MELFNHNSAKNNLELPLGFGIALSKNIDAMQYFSSLSLQHQKEIIDQTHDISSKDEMQRFVDNLTNNSF